MGRWQQKQFEAVNTLSGRYDCSEALLLERRARWVVPFVVVVWTAMSQVFPESLGDALRGGLAGLVAYGFFAALNKRFLLARCGGILILASLRWYSSNPVKVLLEVERPAQSTVGEGALLKRVSFAGEEYLLARSLEARFRAATRL
jgi:hypothetical protein